MCLSTTEMSTSPEKGLAVKARKTDESLTDVRRDVSLFSKQIPRNLEAPRTHPTIRKTFHLW
jgi:hypothetical protein